MLLSYKNTNILQPSYAAGPLSQQNIMSVSNNQAFWLHFENIPREEKGDILTFFFSASSVANS